MAKFLLIFLAPLIISQPAQALVELRAGYGIIESDEDPIEGSGVSSGSVVGYNLDAIVELPMMPIGIGLRYEDFGFDTTGSGVDIETSLQRTSLLVNYRLIDFFTYFGFIGTLGLINDASIEGTIPLLGNVNIEYESSMTYSIGVEGGLSFGLVMVGAELGYLMGTMEQKNGTGEFDIDGIYAKALVGVGF